MSVRVVGRSDINHTALAFVATADGGVLKTLLVRIGARARRGADVLSGL